MDFITEDGYQVKPGMQEEYQKLSGSWRDLFRIDSYAALDRMAAEGRRPGSELARLQRESGRFIDLTRGPERWTHNLYKNVVDATIIDVEPSEEKELVGAGR